MCFPFNCRRDHAGGHQNPAIINAAGTLVESAVVGRGVFCAARRLDPALVGWRFADLRPDRRRGSLRHGKIAATIAQVHGQLSQKVGWYGVTP